MTTWGTNADDAAAALKQFGNNVVALEPDESSGPLRGVATQGYTGRSDQPKVATATATAGACVADVDQIKWSTFPVAAAFLASGTFGGDLPTDAKLTGPSNDLTTTVDQDSLAAQVAKTLAALGPLAYSADAVANREVNAQVTDLRVESPVEGATAPVTGRYQFDVTLDPGDGAQTASLSVPIRCTAVNSTSTHVAKTAIAVAGNPTYTG